ncbi:hypothetical protein EVAR_21094_1 [Eumeta japonica]|uniref:Uncharacterized protein n=1 Tax=Eumeta variegata TaxID=151549 RepID=A0A4C1V0M9_EUMVA|nr:hypothetical protein EVAR_21094_1 [Eumeta japonica]
MKFDGSDTQNTDILKLSIFNGCERQKTFEGLKWKNIIIHELELAFLRVIVPNDSRAGNFGSQIVHLLIPVVRPRAAKRARGGGRAAVDSASALWQHHPLTHQRHSEHYPNAPHIFLLHEFSVSDDGFETVVRISNIEIVDAVVDSTKGLENKKA